MFWTLNTTAVVSYTRNPGHYGEVVFGNQENNFNNPVTSPAFFLLATSPLEPKHKQALPPTVPRHTARLPSTGCELQDPGTFINYQYNQTGFDGSHNLCNKYLSINYF